MIPKRAIERDDGLPTQRKAQHHLFFFDRASKSPWAGTWLSFPIPSASWRDHALFDLPWPLCRAVSMSNLCASLRRVSQRSALWPPSCRVWGEGGERLDVTWGEGGGLSNSRVTILEDKKARHTQKSHVAHIARGSNAIFRSLSTMVAADLATGILIHTRTQNQHRNRENTHSDELCYLIFALLYDISTHTCVLFHGRTPKNNFVSAHLRSTCM